MTSLGIDIGTSSVKVVLLDKVGEFLHAASLAHGATLKLEDPGKNEQNVFKIFKALTTCLSSMSEQLAKVERIGVSGQMHGVVLWNADVIKERWPRNTLELLAELATHQSTDDLEQFGNHGEMRLVSNLITWQDQRVTSEFLTSLNSLAEISKTSLSTVKLCTGFGCASLAWLNRFENGSLAQFTHAATIQDFLVWVLTGGEKFLMSPQNAASFGYFDLTTTDWNRACLTHANIPEHILPTIAQQNTVIQGQLVQEFVGIQKNVEVMVSLGDLQCSVYSQLKPDSCVLQLSTSAQLSFKVNKDNCSSATFPSSVSVFPYFDGSNLAVAPSLNGGNVFDAFARFLMEAFEIAFEAPCDIDAHDVLSKLIKHATDGAAPSINNGNCHPEASITDLTVVPTLFGERHDTTSTASVLGIGLSSLRVDRILRATAQGIIENLNQMLPTSLLKEHGVKTVIATGQAATKLYLPHIQGLYSEQSFTVISGATCDSAYGAALLAFEANQQKNPM